MEEQVLKIGMPAGSLADPNRGGNLLQLLENSGFKTSGYEKGGPSKFSTINYMFGWDGRPQEFGAQLGINEIDVAIAGDDWIQERILELKYEYKTKLDLEKVLSLKRGDVKIVGIIDKEHQADTIQDFLKYLSNQPIITVVAEMPYLALNWIKERLAEIYLDKKYSKFSVQKYKTPVKIKQGIVIFETWGKTEAKVKNKGADIGMEITQTGSSLKNYDLKIVDTVMTSETGIWINPKLKKDKIKKELLEMFLLNLYGAVNAEDKVMVIFNVANIYKEGIEDYLRKNYLFADEPTMNIGKSFTEFSIQIDISNPKIPLAKLRYELAKRKAVNINTIPVNSCIQSIDILDFDD
ncbi:MAG: hypothetical protein JXB17_00905 [Bacteroidales bacterium]|nr:hypothetical protein [Bacteroidales bacterium]